jgi:MFS family permease
VLVHLKTFLRSPWRAVPLLGLTQILAWGALFYPPVLTVPLIAAERGWSLSFAMGGFSGGLFVGGIVAPFVGRSIDRVGGHAALTAGALAGAAGLALLTVAANPLAYFAVWSLAGAAMAASLYDPAFATLGRIFGHGARRPITLVTFAGGFASTASWPATLFLIDHVGWRGAYLVYAAILAFIVAPLYAFALPRERADPLAGTAHTRAQIFRTVPPAGFTFAAVIAAASLYAFIPSGLSAHLLAIFKRGGIDPVTAVTIGALFGPAQVFMRIAEFLFGSNTHPLAIGRGALIALLLAFAMLLVAGISTPVAALFAILFGASNGLLTVARGTVPLALFGPNGYGQVVGRIAGPSLIAQAVAPFAVAFIAEHASDEVALLFVAFIACVSLACFFAVRRPQAEAAH